MAMTTVRQPLLAPPNRCTAPPTRTLAPTRVLVQGGDAVTRAGVASLLNGARDIRTTTDDGPADIAIVVVDSLTRSALALIRRLGSDPNQRLVLVLGELSQEALAIVLQAGAVGLIRRQAATTDNLPQLVRSVAAGDAVVPADLLNALVPNRTGDRTDDEQPGPVSRLLAMACMTDRELAVLEMLGDGADTREISRRMCYSERTVKTIIQDVIRRFGLRNRAHAVAYAVRHGLI
jgi:DNA-binding NarL/FixJ family response regulator